MERASILPRPWRRRCSLAFLAALAACLLQSACVRHAAGGNDDSICLGDELCRYEEADRAQPPPRNATLFIGSSSIRLWDTLKEDFPGLRLLNRGFGGSTIADCVKAVPRIVAPYAPKQIVFYAGDNDIAAGRLPTQVESDFRDFVSATRKQLPDVPIYFVSIKPSEARWQFIDKVAETNARIKRYADHTLGVFYVDVFTEMIGPDERPRRELFRDDKLHMNRDGYKLWAAKLRPLLK